MKFRGLLLAIIISLVAGLLLVRAVQLSVWDYNSQTYQLEIGKHTYDLKNPKMRWELPGKLEEISGLSYYRHNQLGCIQDEKGILFLYDLDKEDIVDEWKFGEKGDYEGVEIVDDMAYILRSDGEIICYDMESGDSKKIKTQLSGKNDAEGLGYLSESGELLIACKEQPGIKKEDLKNSRAIYRMKLSDKEVKKHDRYLIEGGSYNKMLDEKGLSKKKHKPFKPSGIAVHPETGDIFVIGTVGKMMLVMNRKGKIVDLIPLDPEIFIQPEGIAFSPEGDLYISSEGRGKKGYILKF